MLNKKSMQAIANMSRGDLIALVSMLSNRIEDTKKEYDNKIDILEGTIEDLRIVNKHLENDNKILLNDNKVLFSSNNILDTQVTSLTSAKEENEETIETLESTVKELRRDKRQLRRDNREELKDLRLSLETLRDSDIQTLLKRVRTCDMELLTEIEESIKLEHLTDKNKVCFILDSLVSNLRDKNKIIKLYSDTMYNNEGYSVEHIPNMMINSLLKISEKINSEDINNDIIDTLFSNN